MTEAEHTTTSVNLKYPVAFGKEDMMWLVKDGVYERRTFWQWLFRRPRRLKLFKVKWDSLPYADPAKQDDEWARLNGER